MQCVDETKNKILLIKLFNKSITILIELFSNLVTINSFILGKFNNKDIFNCISIAQETSNIPLPERSRGATTQQLNKTFHI